MKILIFSDVHGNLPAFRKMLREAGQCDRYICLGDLVNYGPWSNECVALALSLPACEYIMGNHEEAFLHGFYPGTNPLVKQFFDLCSKDFMYYDEIKKFQSRFVSDGFVFEHTIGNASIYPDTKIALDADYVIGHSHHQFVYRNNNHVLYNAGSVGQNRQYINIINYLILDTESREMEFCELEYDVGEVIDAMRALAYPPECLLYYDTKPRKQMF